MPRGQAMNVLEDLLHIKEFREDKAERELAQARHVLRQASEAFERARTTRDDYRVAADRKERALYADLCTRVVQLSDLDDVALEVDRMRKEKDRHEEQVAAAASAREEASQQADAARVRHREAVRMREKFSELSVLLEAGQEVERQRLEDTEMEEVRLARRPANAQTDEPDDAQGDEPEDALSAPLEERS